MGKTFKYCSACGCRHEIGLNVLRFCTNCGNPFDAALAAKNAIGKKNVSQVVNETEVEEDEATDIPQINASDYVISDIPTKMTVKDVANNSALVGRGEESPNITPEQLAQQLKTLFEKEQDGTIQTKNKT